MKNTTHSDYVKRLEGFINEIEEKLPKLENPSKQYLGSLGGQLTVLKRELEYFKTHKITQM